MNKISVTPLPPHAKSMTSIHLHGIIVEATGKYAELKNFHKHIKKVLNNQASSILELAQKTDRGAVAYYNLNEVQANMVMASIDYVHLELITEVFVHTKNNAPAQNLLASPEQDRLGALGFMAKEFTVTGADKIVMFSKGLASFPDLQNALPSYNSSKFVGTVGEVSERVAHAYSHHKNTHDLELSAVAFNKLLTSQGMLQREHSSSGRAFNSIIGDGLNYGKNVVPNQKTTQTQPHWYDDSILDLYDELCTINVNLESVPLGRRPTLIITDERSLEEFIEAGWTAEMIVSKGRGYWK
jgi:hypothetical protein